MSKRDSVRDFEEFYEAARRDLFPKLRESAIVMSVLTGSIDAKLAMELGASLLMDKPIMLLIEKGTKISDRLRMIADEIVEFDEVKHPTTQAKIAAALQRISAKLHG